MSRFFTTNPTGLLDACYCECLRPCPGGLAALEAGRIIPHAAPGDSADRACPDCRGYGIREATGVDYAREIRRRKAEIAALRAENDTLQAELSHATAENDRLHCQLDAAFVSFGEAQQEIQSLKDAQEALWGQQCLAVAGWKRVCDELKAKLRQAEEIERIRLAFARKDRLE